MTDRFLIIGGGVRLIKAAEAFIKNGVDARIYKGDEPLKNAIEASDVILLGIPASKDGVYLDTDDPQTVSVRDLAAMCTKRKLVLGGRLQEKVKALFDVYSVRWADYSLYPEFEILNAVPTAEGAIQLAMEEFPFTIHSSKTLVTGYGRVSKALSVRLKALGSECTIAARSPSQRAEAEAMGFEAIDLSRIPEKVKDCQIIFNTVPSCILGKDVLSCMTPRMGIIDLASKPGGVDLESAKTYGINVIWALGLPGKVAPESAGEIIRKTACNIVRDLQK